MNNKKGISLIVLVITILVMIILAGVVVVSLQKNNPIDKAKEAQVKETASSVRNAVSQYAATAQASDNVDAEMNKILGAEEVTGLTGYKKLKAGSETIQVDTGSITVKEALGVDTAGPVTGSYFAATLSGECVLVINDSKLAEKLGVETDGTISAAGIVYKAN